MPFGIQPIHLIIIVIVALIIFGPQRLPELGRNLGKALTEFRRGTREMTDAFREEATKPTTEPAVPAASTAAPISTVQPAASRFCTQCGTVNPVDARFCKNCGAQLAG